MADSAKTTATFALNLSSNAPQTGREVAASLEDLRSKMVADIESAKGLQVALRQLKGGGNVASSSIKTLKDQLTAKKATIADVTQKYLRLGGDVRKLKPASQVAGAGMKELVASLSAAGGPLARVTAQAGTLRTLFSGGVLAGAGIGVAAALAAVAVGGAAAAAGIFKFSFAASEARRSELLLLEGMTRLRPTMAQMYFGIGRVADSAGFLQTTIDQVTRGVAIGRDQVAGYASEFYRLGLRSGNLQAALEGVSIAAATQGETGVAQFKALALNAALYGGSVRRVADDFKARLGPIAAQQMLSLGVQVRKAKESLSQVFAGLKIEPVLNAVRQLFRHFDSGSATARAMQATFKALFQPLINSTPGAASVLERFMKGAVIGALDVTIAFLKIRNVVADAVGPAFRKLRDSIDWFGLGKNSVYGFALIFSQLPALISVTAAELYSLAKPFIWIFELQKKVLDAPWKETGINIVRGIADGIRGGIKWILDAIGHVKRATLSAFTGAFKIHSPSRLMRDEIGLQLPKGQALGMRDGRRFIEKEVQANVELVRGGSALTGTPGSAPVAAVARDRGRKDVTVSIANVTIPQPPPGTPVAEIQRLIRDGVRDAIVDAAVSMGAM